MLNTKNNNVIRNIIILIGLVFFTAAIYTLINICNKKHSSYSDKLLEIIEKEQQWNLIEKEIENYELAIKKELDINLNDNMDNSEIKQDYYALGVIKYLENENIKSIEYLNKALEYGGIENTYENTIELDINIYSLLSSNYIIEQRLEESEDFFEEAKIIALKGDKKYLLCDLYYNKAKTIASSGYNINTSIDLMRKSLEYTDIDIHKIRNYLYLSTLYKLTENVDLALEYIINALEISMKLNDDVLIQKCVISLGEIYYTQKNYSKTIYIYEGYFSDHKLEDNENKLLVYGYLAECYAKEGNYEKYTMYKEKYIELGDRIGDDKSLAWLYIVCADIEIGFSNLEKAKEYLNNGQVLYDENMENMFSNTDIMISFVKLKISYFENNDYTKTLAVYEGLLETLKNRGIKSDINSEIVSEVLVRSLENDDFKTFEKYIKDLDYNDKNQSSQTYTDSIYAGISNKVKEDTLRKERFKTLILLILSVISIYEVVNSKKKNIKINKLNKELTELNALDPLTNIYNRGYLIEQLRLLKENEKDITFVMIDIDYFKLYNDNYGHIKGDEVLISVANIIKDIFKEDMVFRYGGEEFSIISNKIKYDVVRDIDYLMERLHDENIIHEYSNVSDRVTLSIGVSSNKVWTEYELLELTNLADKNLYKAKKNGRNRYVY